MASPSYPAWYALPEQDPYHGVYGDVCTAMEAARLAALLPGALMTHFTMGQDTKAVFVLLGSDGRVSLIHRLALQAPLFGAPSIHSGSVFATLSLIHI